MGKFEKILDSLEKDIASIKNKDDFELSADALRGHLNRYTDEMELITHLLKKGKILDVGSSPYHLTYCLKKLGFDVWGIDINPMVLKKFQIKHGLKIKRCNIEKEKTPFKDHTFDLVVFTEILEHLGNDPLGVLKEVHRVLKPGGLIFLSTPNIYTLHKIIMFVFGRSFNDVLGELRKVKSTGYMGHMREYSNREVKMILGDCGFKIKTTYFKKYNNYFTGLPIVQKTPLILLGLFLEMMTKFIVWLRPTQIVIAEKGLQE